MEKFIYPEIIAHRGASAYAPENTLTALRRAKALGAKCVEVDVRLLIDGTLVLFHDDDLRRVAQKSDLIEDMPLVEVKKIDAGCWFGDQFVGEAVPTLEETLACLIELDLAVNFELKPNKNNAKALAMAMIQFVDKCWPQELMMPLISSFSSESIALAAKFEPRLTYALNVSGSVCDETLAKAKMLLCQSIHVEHDKIDQHVVERINSHQMKVMCFTVNELARANQLLDFGVTGLFSDYPDLLAH